MKIDRVMLVWDGNEFYSGFYEMHEKLWAKLGIKTLHEGHKGWATVRPMATPETPATVIPMRRRK